MVYRPLSSVTAVLTLSIRAGLVTSTVTPGSTAPDVSLTSPAMALDCAAASVGSSRTSIATSKRLTHFDMLTMPP